MMLQLDPPLPLRTPRGPGLAHFLIDYGPESHLLWVVFLDADGACWTVPNPEVRMAANWTMGRRPVAPIADGAAAAAACHCGARAPASLDARAAQEAPDVVRVP